MAASAAISGFGTVFQTSDGGGTPVFSTLAEVRSISGPTLSRGTIDVTHLLSPDEYKEFIAGMKDGGEISMELNFLGITADTSQIDLIDNINTSSPLRTHRVVFPDESQSATVTFAGSTATTSGSHGFNTVQPVRFRTAGTIPSPLIIGKLYFARRLSATTLSIHTTPEAAAAGTGAITFTGGSGAHTIKSGSTFTFSAMCTGFEPKSETEKQLMASVKFKLSGKPTLTP